MVNIIKIELHDASNFMKITLYLQKTDRIISYENIVNRRPDLGHIFR